MDSTVTTPVAKLFLRLLITGRLVLAFTTVLAPHRALRTFQIPGDGTPAPALFRMFGVRNGALGLGLLHLNKFSNPRVFVASNIFIDAIDGLAFESARRRGEFSKPGAAITTGLATAAVVAGIAIYSGTPSSDE